ncbi:alpha/beta hydrolase family protein [Fusobacterium sp. PH5-44]|uniref:alpha/beta hydrolase family protein n=1 Tax=unclassified Fusobacterium TaxID=2648384 RepID=UPI003D20A809
MEKKLEKINLDDFLKYKFISNFLFSPNGETGAFVVHQSDYEENKYNSNIWTIQRKTKKIQKLTSLNDEKNFVWLDNNTIIFKGNRDKKIQKKVNDGETWTSYYSININGGEAEKFFDLPLNISQVKPINKSILMLVAQYDNSNPIINDFSGEKRANAIKKQKEDKDYEVIDEIPFWHNGSGFSNQKRDRIYIYNIEDNSVIPVTGTHTYLEYVSLNKENILYVGNEFNGKLEQTAGIFQYNIKTKKTKTLLPNKKYMVQMAEYLNDNTIICALSDGKNHGLNENSNFYIIKNEKLSLLKEQDTWLANTVGSDCRYGSGKPYKVYNGKLFFPSTIGKSSFLCSIDENGKQFIYTKDNGSVDDYDVCGNDIFFIGLRGSKLQEIYQANKTGEKQLSKFNEEFYKNKYIAKPKKISYKGEHSVIDGWVLEPKNYDKTKKYPGILDIHGGPKTAYGEIFFHEMQLWASMGYFVFFCNPRGSDGKGNEFADIRGKYGTIDYEDLMNFTDSVLKKYPQIDQKRIGVTGGSYGGFMTNWIIGHTDRFKCAVSQRSIANWISKFCTTDIGYYFNADQNQSTPWIDYDKLWWHSPMKYADKAKTPTLFIHSEEDYRCWLPEGIQMFTALKYHGVEARLCMFRGENHELSRSGKPKHRIRRLEEMTNWFEKFLKK